MPNSNYIADDSLQLVGPGTIRLLKNFN